MTEPIPTTPAIYAAISAIMDEVGPIAKKNKNLQQGYQFRGIDDVYEALQAIMAKHKVFAVPEVLEDRTEERTTKNGSALIYRVLKIKYTFYAHDGSNVVCIVIGEGMDSGDKASNKAMSVAQKYAFIQVFCIPTREPKDPEHDSPGQADGGIVAKGKESQKNANKPKPTAQKSSGFNPDNKAHMDFLFAALSKSSIDPEVWDEIAQKMKGRPSAEIGVVMKEYEKDVEEEKKPMGSASP